MCRKRRHWHLEKCQVCNKCSKQALVMMMVMAIMIMTMVMMMTSHEWEEAGLSQKGGGWNQWASEDVCSSRILRDASEIHGQSCFSASPLSNDSVPEVHTAGSSRSLPRWDFAWKLMVGAPRRWAAEGGRRPKALTDRASGSTSRARLAPSLGGPGSSWRVCWESGWGSIYPSNDRKEGVLGLQDDWNC